MEASHDDILRRVAAVERTQDAMRTQIENSDDQITQLRSSTADLTTMVRGHRDEFSAFRGEMRGGIMVAKFGIPLLVAVALAILGSMFT